MRPYLLYSESLGAIKPQFQSKCSLDIHDQGTSRLQSIGKLPCLLKSRVKLTHLNSSLPIYNYASAEYHVCISYRLE